MQVKIKKLHPKSTKFVSSNYFTQYKVNECIKYSKLIISKNIEILKSKILVDNKVPRKKIEPSRSSICILGTILGFMLGVLIVLVHSYFKKD